MRKKNKYTKEQVFIYAKSMPAQKLVSACMEACRRGKRILLPSDVLRAAERGDGATVLERLLSHEEYAQVICAYFPSD